MSNWVQQTINLNDYLSDTKSALEKFEGASVLIVGDVGLDEYIVGDVKRISPEAPVPVVEVQKQDHRIGLAANVAANVTCLGGKAQLVGVVGEDAAYENLSNLLEKYNISSENLVVDPDRPTTLKTRIMAGHQQIVRVDHEKRRYLSDSTRKQLLNKVENQLPHSDVVVVQDYAKGIFDEQTCQEVIKLAQAHKKLVLVDPNRNTPVSYYKGADLFKPNKDEALSLAGLSFDDHKEDYDVLLAAGEKLKQTLGSKYVIVTAGKQGMRIFHEQKMKVLPTYARDVFDVTGAGDTVVGTIALGLASHLEIEMAGILANFAAGVVVGQVGCVPCLKKDLVEYIESHQE
ncbi:MAG: D-glycero-beta-D-manno-heptose-7-phosphate kinase [Bdellovibrionales bacterium]|nr:D-glycero-beta-D-manno-heptose-7-phosphate kinase [Bdellovibrionales bacterium]